MRLQALFPNLRGSTATPPGGLVIPVFVSTGMNIYPFCERNRLYLENAVTFLTEAAQKRL
jgi:hypothetical protein